MDDEVEIPELGPRQPPGKSDEAAKLLSRVKNALRADGLYPSHNASAGVEWDPDREAWVIKVEVVHDPLPQGAGKAEPTCEDCGLPRGKATPDRCPNGAASARCLATRFA